MPNEPELGAQESLLTRIKHCVEVGPSAIAVRDAKDQEYSYETLWKRSEDIAARLARSGVGAGEHVALLLPRNFELIAGVIAIWRCGAGYVPIDPAYPPSRIGQMIELAQARVLLTSKDTPFASLEGTRVVAEDIVVAEQIVRSSDESSAPQDVARKDADTNPGYVIFTSGSTGVPKGVQMHRAPLRNLIEWQLRNTSVGRGAATLQFSPITFDVSFQEIFATLCAGGTLVLIDEDTRLDSDLLLKRLKDARVERLFLPFVALQGLSLAAQRHKGLELALREVVTAGEQLRCTSAVRSFFERTDATLWNHYGPSETHVATAYRLQGEPSSWPDLPPIGRPIDGVLCHVMTETQSGWQPVAQGEQGELLLGGLAPAMGYMSDPERTHERFFVDPFDANGRVYRTGDLVREDAQGAIEFLGRADDQVKVRGYRVELGEVEHALERSEAVAHAAVTTRLQGGEALLVGFVVAKDTVADSDRGAFLGALRESLRERLPEYMIPTRLELIADLPRTASGKVDRKSLPEVFSVRPDLAVNFVLPQSGLAEEIASVWASVLEIDRVGAEDNFFDLGGSSLAALRAAAELKQRGHSISAVHLFEFPTVSALASFIDRGREVDPRAEALLRAQTSPGRLAAARDDEHDIAVIGMSFRFPGANTIEDLWRVLCEGQETCTRLSLEEIDPEVPHSQKMDPRFVPARGLIDQADAFDAQFFGIYPREAEALDPQQRVFLEIAWNALEQAGYGPMSAALSRVGLTGVYAGTGNNTYYATRVLPNKKLIDAVGEFGAMAANEKDYVATRVAHKLDLSGPALSVVTACSTSLVAIIEATLALRMGLCDLALAGGSSVACPPRNGYLHQAGGMLCSDAHCRPFDALAEGTYFSDGAGAVVLRRLGDALRDGDQIYAVIKGVGINNDGADKASFTAPSVTGQARAVAAAHADARIDPESVGYVEAHGTATPLGDPIEVQALQRAFGVKEKQYCALGSIKSNFGHLTAAAGVAGLIKAALCLHHRALVPTVHFRTPNPAIDFTDSPFYVSDTHTPWESPRVRVAGVSSFGVGGTNAHVVLEQAPEQKSSLRPVSEEGKAPALWLWSAKSESALEVQIGAAPSPAEVDRHEAARTMQVGRAHFAHRAFAVVSVNTGSEKLDFVRDKVIESDGSVIFAFPGQGAQYPRMGHSLYREYTPYRSTFDRVDAALEKAGHPSLKRLLIDGEADEQALRRTQLTQPAIFAVEVSLAELFQSWGIRPSAVIGHSIGEYAAAVTAGVMSLEDATRLIAARGALMGALPEGVMLSISRPMDEVTELLSELGSAAQVAVVNGPSSTVVGAAKQDIERLQTALETRDIAARVLRTSHAFHTEMMEPMLASFQEVVDGVELFDPALTFYSTVTQSSVGRGELSASSYWVEHVRRPVMFYQTVTRLWADHPHGQLVELGPRATLCALCAPARTDREAQGTFPAMPRKPEEESELSAALGALGALWARGARPDWDAVNPTRRRARVPGYSFSRTRYWSVPPSTPFTEASSTEASLPQASASLPASSLPQSVVAAPASQLHWEPNLPVSRPQHLEQLILESLRDASGLELEDADPSASFLELGLDSLLLTQVALNVSKTFGHKVSFRQLMDALDSPSRLAAHLDGSLPEGKFAPKAPEKADAPVATASGAQPASRNEAASPPPAPSTSYTPPHLAPQVQFEGQRHQPVLSQTVAGVPAPGEGLAQVFAAQLDIIRRQLEAITAVPTAAVPDTAVPNTAVPNTAVPNTAVPSQPVAPAPPVTQPVATPPHVASPQSVATPQQAGSPNGRGGPSMQQPEEPKKTFGAGARIGRDAASMTDQQRNAFEEFSRSYLERTGASKAFTANNRAQLADPRAVSGFTPWLKELTFPIVVDRSEGAYVWDIDGNKYIDITCGFGANYLGHRPKVVNEAVAEQLERGYEIGPQHPLAAEVGTLVRELTKMERLAFCNTGSEAVLAALRLSRTVTGNDLVVMFDGAYHGLFDEVIVRGSRRHVSFPAAPGIPRSAVENTLILDYDDPKSLEVIRERSAELAAILVEPVQSRAPHIQPKAFLEELRKIADASGAALIFDEVITGFRIAPGGAQEHFGVRADIATYGKIPGGGLPIGMVTGRRRFMDALDGGAWQYGDDSFPEVGVTYFAGTFVRHPLTLAAMRATLTYLKEQGPSLQARTNAMGDRLCKTVNDALKQRGCTDVALKNFGSLFKPKLDETNPFGTLFFHWMRRNGVHVWDARPCFVTAAHTEEDVDELIARFMKTIDEMQRAGFLGGSPPEKTQSKPHPEARLGRTPDGQPAWFVPDPARPGKFMKLDEK